MKKLMAAFAMFLGVTSSAYGESISMSKYYQKQKNWCWAAVSQTVRKNNKNFFRLQCKMASAMHAPNRSRTYCCGNNNRWENERYNNLTNATRRQTCDQANNTGRALRWNKVYQSQISGPANSSDIARQLRANDPVVVSVGWDSGGGHAMIIFGINQSNLAGASYNLWNPGRGRGAETILRVNLLRYQGRSNWRTTYFTD